MIFLAAKHLSWMNGTFAESGMPLSAHIIHPIVLESSSKWEVIFRGPQQKLLAKQSDKNDDDDKAELWEEAGLSEIDPSNRSIHHQDQPRRMENSYDYSHCRNTKYEANH